VKTIAPAPQLSSATGSNRFDGLPGWTTDRVADAMPALLRGCARLALAPIDQQLGGTGPGAQAGDWRAPCAAARALPPNDEAAAREFLQSHFDLVPLTDAAHPEGLFTGYYEPQVEGSRERTRIYRFPLLAKPDDLIEQTAPDGTRRYGHVVGGQFAPYYTRAEIDHGALRRQRLDLLYLKSPIDLFFLQVQGAGRVELPNGLVVRVGYAGTNGQPYVPIGRVLSEAGDIPPDQVSAQTIRDWLQSHPRDAQAVMEQNPRYTFFRDLPNVSPDEGPPGTLGVQLTPLRSIAVDPARIPLGAPVWIDTTNVDGTQLQRLMLAQDTGTAMAGGLHLDIFYGWGDLAEDQAGRMQAQGRAWMLLPKAAPAS
jgi:membrane-bound lytic murein transglycosylase A